ncbi:MAG: TetR family transcriptional regulator [Aggregatilineales bacterium]
MGRKKLTEERTTEILDAFARCMVKYGLDTSLDQVAEEAGMTRSIIRHYIGNREEVVNVLIERITADFLAELQTEAAQIPQEQMIAATLDYLFDDEAGYDNTDKLIFDVMMTAQDRYLQAKQTLIGMFEELITMFADDLEFAYPQADKTHCRDVAYSVLGLAMSHESLQGLGMNKRYHATARTNAETLIRTLEFSG